MTSKEFIEECAKIGIDINDDKLELFNKYKDLLIEWNKKFNLTTILKDEDIFLKHFYDSLCLNKAISFEGKQELCDFGTGAGFPGIPIAIVYPNINVTLLESNGKKITFLNEVKKELNLSNVRIMNQRVEDFAKNNREKFDIVTCRAVSNLGIICELSIALLKINGTFAPLKSKIEEEINNYIRDINKVGYELKKTENYDLPKEDSKRSIPIFIKQSKTSNIYPRSYNAILKAYK